MIALMLQVRPCLTWRDVQHIIVFTATKYEDRHAAWERNGAGFSHSHQHGFGLLNAWRLVNAAKVWDSVPYLASYISPTLREGKSIPMVYPGLELAWNVTDEDLEASGMRTLEHVAVTVTITHPRRGNLEIKLFCPSGISSLIGAPRKIDTDPTGYVDWTFSTVRCWGEQAKGTYRIIISDIGDEPLAAGTLKQWQLTLYGSSWSLAEVLDRQRLVENAMSGQYLDDNFSLPCSPGLKISEQETYRMTSNTLKTLLLLGCFTVFWSVYYMLEVFLTRKNLDIDITCRRSGCRWAQGRGDYRLASTGVDLESGIDMEVLPLCLNKNNQQDENPEPQTSSTGHVDCSSQELHAAQKVTCLQDPGLNGLAQTSDSLLHLKNGPREC